MLTRHFYFALTSGLYRRCHSATPSVKEYVLASSRRAALEVFAREGDGSWSLRRYGAGDIVRLTSLDCQLAVDDAYLKVLGPDLD